MVIRGKFAAPAMAAVSLLLFAAPALADTRHAAPTDVGLGDCSDPDNACDLPTAVSGAGAGDVVQLAVGDYSLSSTIELANGVRLQGTSATDATVLNSTATVAVRIAESSVASRIQSLTINHAPAGGSPTIGLEQRNGIVSQVIVTTGTANYACFVGGAINTPLLRDSVCANSAGAGVAAGAFNSVDTDGWLYNVTALATAPSGYAIFASSSVSGADIALALRNTIANGGTTDQGGHAEAGGSILIDFDSSNYDSVGPFSGTGSIQGTNVGALSNQSEPPLLDANYRQLPGSPTINAGFGGLLDLGTIDFETDPRIQGEEIDIGADEAEGDPPDTTIDGRPPRRTSKRSARFLFSSTDPGEVTFECRLDGKPFRACSSGIRYRNLKRRKHTFSVRSIDGFFNTDPVPAKYRWTIKRKRR